MTKIVYTHDEESYGGQQLHPTGKLPAFLLLKEQK